MKKILAAVVSVLLVAAMAVSFAACSKGDPVKVIDVSLSGEPYGYCYDKENKDIEDAINQLIFDLCGSQEFNPEIEGSGSDAKGVLYDYDGDYYCGYVLTKSSKFSVFNYIFCCFCI